jgi:hypothetical protein
LRGGPFYVRSMKLQITVALLATTGFALAKPAKLETVKIDAVTLGVPAGWKAAIGPRCIAMEGPGSLYVFRTATSREDFDKSEAASKGKRVAKDKVLCFELTKPGENARCLVTTDAGNWITQFVGFGKKYTPLGGADAMKDIVTSIKGWDGKPYDGTFAEGNDCRAVK